MTRTAVPILRAAVLAAFALVLAHQAVYLVRYGSIYGEALAHAGHGQAWSDAVTVVVLGSGFLLVASLVGLRRLARRVQVTSGPRRSDRIEFVEFTERPDARAIAGRWLRTWIWLAAAVLVLLTVQENLEHAATGFGLPGAGILLGADYPFAVAIVAAVVAAVSLVATLLAWRRDVLIGRLRTRSATHARSIAPSRPVTRQPALARTSTLGRRLGRRAPPSPSAA